MSDTQNQDPAKPSGGQAEVQTPEPPPMRPKQRPSRTILRLVLLVGVPASALIFGAWWYQNTGRYVSTENAYVKSHIVAISPNIDGRVIKMLVEENQRVAAGDMLFTLDPESYWMQIRMAEAKRDATHHELEGIRAEYGQIIAEIEQAKANAAYHLREAERQRKLATREVTTRARLDQAEFNLTAARQSVNTLRQKLRTVLARLGGKVDQPAAAHPDLIAAETEIAIAKMNLDYTRVRAPASGVVTRLRLEAGEWVEEGEPAFGLIADDHAWIEANLKETQLTHVREGQAVKVEIDAYPDAVWQAKVASISPATGAEFSVLPPQNASGNWVKVVQRLPVRIEVETKADQPILRAGMTATVTVDTHHKRSLFATIAGLF